MPCYHILYLLYHTTIYYVNYKINKKPDSFWLCEIFLNNNCQTWEYREYFDIVTSRAVAQLRILSELSIPYLKVGGKFIAMKGLADEEIIESKEILTKLDSEIIETINFNLPIENSNRSLVVIEKKKETNKIYPRNYDKIVKNKKVKK